MKLEYKGFWLSVRPMKGDIRFECQIVNIKNYNYELNAKNNFWLGVFFAENDTELEQIFHKTVDALKELGLDYDDYGYMIEELNEHNIKWNK